MASAGHVPESSHHRSDRRQAAGTAARRDDEQRPLAALQRAAGNRAVSALIQAKLKVGAVDDPLEREADRVAKKVVSGQHHHAGPACADCGPVAQPSDTPAIRRSAAGTGAAGTAGGETDATTDAAIRQASGRGRALEPDVQRSMEAGFGVDFSGVRVHDGAQADGLNRQLGARAFTTGSDIFFRSGEYAPATPGGKELLAHELTHVVQQGAAGPAETVHRSADPDAVQRKAYPIGSTGESLEIGFFTFKKERDALLAEAETIINDLKTTYDVTVSSTTTIEGIKDSYGDVKQKVRDSLRTKAWNIKELRALKRALGHYAAILGANREQSSRKGIDQEVTSVGKVAQAINEDTPAGKLDTTTLGEYFASKKNMGLFKASENFTADFKKLEDQLTGTFVHEIAHGLLAYAIPDYVAATGYWESRYKELPKPKRTESPVTDYGGKNAAEDLCESAMMYFVEPSRLKKKCPLRYAFMEQLGKDWVPAPAQAPQVQPEAEGKVPDVVVSPKDSQTPPELEQAEEEIEEILDKVEPAPKDAPDEGPGTGDVEAPTTEAPRKGEPVGAPT